MQTTPHNHLQHDFNVQSLFQLLQETLNNHCFAYVGFLEISDHNITYHAAGPDVRTRTGRGFVPGIATQLAAVRQSCVVPADIHRADAESVPMHCPLLHWQPRHHRRAVLVSVEASHIVMYSWRYWSHPLQMRRSEA